MRNRNIAVALFVLVFTAFSINPPAGTVAARVNTGADDPSQFIGLYPDDVFKQYPQFKQRLKHLLGTKYAFFNERMAVQAPFDKKGDAIISRSCEAHNCGIEEAVIAVTLSGNKLSCAILSDLYHGKYKIISEDPQHLPAALLEITNK